VLERTGLIRFDPWISYALLIGLAVLALYAVEKPAQKRLRKWMGVSTVVKERRVAMVSADRDGP
jgi:peptidoglycan/LPS O-acetylase OafA/YrhL